MMEKKKKKKRDIHFQKEIKSDNTTTSNNQKERKRFSRWLSCSSGYNFCCFALVTIDIWRDSLGVFVASVMISLTRSTVQLYTTSHSSRRHTQGQWRYWTRVRPCFFSSCCFSNIFIFIERRRHRAWKIRKVKKEREKYPCRHDTAGQKWKWRTVWKE